jgi:hypothetical protein
LKRAFGRLVRWSALSRHTQFIGTAGGLSSDFLALLSLPLSCPSGQSTHVPNSPRAKHPCPSQVVLCSCDYYTRSNETARPFPHRSRRMQHRSCDWSKKEVHLKATDLHCPAAAALPPRSFTSFTPHSAPSRSALLHARIPFVLLTRARALAPLALTKYGGPSTRNTLT